MTKDKGSSSPSPRIRIYVAACVFLFHLFFYFMTMAPTVTFWDAGEFIATSYILGIPHPPGTPLFVLIGRVWTLIPFLSTAFKMNFLSAFGGAASSTLFYLVISRILREWIEGKEDRSASILVHGGGISAAVASSFMITVWENTTETEVYVLALLTIALFSWLALYWRDNLSSDRRTNIVVLMGFIAGLSVGNHLMALLIGPSLILFILMVDWRTLVNSRTLLALLLFFFLGLSVHLYLPLRASLNPAINEADPSTWQAFWEVLTRKQYGSRSMTVRSADFFRYQIPLYFIYFNDQFGSHWSTWFLSAFGIWGIWEHFKRERRSFYFFFLLFLLTSLGLVIYLNFKIGHTQALEEVPNPQLHEVRERDYFFIVSFMIFGLWIGVGLASAFNWLRERFSSGFREKSAFLYGVAFLTFSPSLLPLVLNYHRADRSGNYIAYDYAYNILQSVEPYGVIFTNGDNDTFPLWFLQEVVHLRQDVTVANLSLLNTPWYIKQIRDRELPPPQELSQETREFLEKEGYDLDELYPSSPIIGLTDEEIDRLAPRRITKSLSYRAGRLSMVYPKGRIFFVKDLIVLHIISTNGWRRPIYFAVTVSDDNKINLFDYLIMQGLAYRIHEMPADSLRHSNPEISFIQETKTYIDVKRTKHLLDEVYSYRGVFDGEVYKTRNTRKLLNNYAAAYSYLGRSLLGENDLSGATEYYEKAFRFNSRNDRFLYLLASLYAQGGNGEKADSLFQEFIDVEGVEPLYFLQMASFFIRGGDTTRGVRYLEETISANPDLKEAYRLLRNVFIDMGESERAEKVALEWQQRHPEEILN